MILLPEIRCTVDNCQYNKDGKICDADGIEVAKNFFGNTDMEAGKMGASPDASNQTKCVTFKPKTK
ncbi:MAG: DUF1540 domain-containing protein [Halanaerobiaceae bacterium]